MCLIVQHTLHKHVSYSATHPSQTPSNIHHVPKYHTAFQAVLVKSISEGMLWYTVRVHVCTVWLPFESWVFVDICQMLIPQIPVSPKTNPLCTTVVISAVSVKTVTPTSRHTARNFKWWAEYKAVCQNHMLFESHFKISNLTASL